MKKVEAIITPHILDAVRAALKEHGCHEFVLSEVRTSRPSKASSAGYYRGNTYELELPKLKLEAVLPEADAMSAAQSILRAARLESRGDPRISVSPLEEVVSIGVSMVECGDGEALDEFPQPKRSGFQGRERHLAREWHPPTH